MERSSFLAETEGQDGGPEIGTGPVQQRARERTQRARFFFGRGFYHYVKG